MQLRHHKSVVSLMGTGVTNGATVTANIDTLDYDYCVVNVLMGTSNNTSNNPSTLKLSESDDTVATNFADIAAFTGDSTAGFTIANADTSNPNVYRLHVDCRTRKRYLKLTVTPVTTQETVMLAQLYDAVELPLSTTKASVHNLVEG